MLARLLATLVKVAVASLIVGTILAHFGITADQILKDFGITPERLAEMMRQGFAWALPNLLLGSLIIVPIWLLVYVFGSKSYQVVVNGYTGRIAGRYPYSPWKIFFIAVAVVFAFILFVIANSN